MNEKLICILHTLWYRLNTRDPVIGAYSWQLMPALTMTSTTLFLTLGSSRVLGHDELTFRHEHATEMLMKILDRGHGNVMSQEPSNSQSIEWAKSDTTIMFKIASLLCDTIFVARYLTPKSCNCSWIMSVMAFGNAIVVRMSYIVVGMHSWWCMFCTCS